jgi:RNA polymerase sigma-70 factor (ECF subfamily)
MSVARPIVDSGIHELEQIARIRGGDELAFQTMFTAHYTSLCEFAASYVDSANAEELVQEVFLEIWRRRESWGPPGGVRPHLFAATRNQALNAIRQQRVASRAAERWFEEASVPGVGQTEADPSGRLVKSEVETVCRRAITPRSRSY